MEEIVIYILSRGDTVTNLLVIAYLIHLVRGISQPVEKANEQTKD